MEKETVLEIEFKELWDNVFAWRITKQDENILRRNDFKDKELDIISSYSPRFVNDILHIRGIFKELDDNVALCTSEEKALIEKKVKAINEKYGIIKRWRGKRNDVYFSIDGCFLCDDDEDFYAKYDNRKYEIGNYFKTEEEAEEYAEYMKKCSLEWHEKRDANDKC